MQDYVRWLIEAGWHLVVGPGEPDDRGMPATYVKIRRDLAESPVLSFARPSMDEALAAAISHSRTLGLEP